MVTDDKDLAEIDSTVAHPARVYDYLLGGKDHFEVDKEAAVHATAAFGGGIDTARFIVRANRDFLGRAVRYLATEAGMRQFLDIGTGIPNADNVHAVALEAAPTSRIVYVDYDPIVLAHAHALLESTGGTTAYIHGDLREPEPILEGAAATLDFSQPVAVVLIGVLHFLRDSDDPHGIVARIVEALAPGSYLALGHLASDINPEEMSALAERYDESVDEAMVVRSHAEVTRFFDGMELVDPGVVPLDQWRPTDPAAATSGFVLPAYGAVARKP